MMNMSFVDEGNYQKVIAVNPLTEFLKEKQT